MNATTENQDRFEIVNDSSAECAAYNESNADAINLGILNPRKPSDRIVQREAQYAKEQEQANLRRKLEAAVIAEVQAVNPTGVKLQVEAVYSGGSTYSSGYHSGWKLTVGQGYGRDANKRHIKIGNGLDLCVTAKQLAKAKDAIAVVASVEAAEKSLRSEKLTVENRTMQFIRDNALFCSRAGHNSYNSGETLVYGTGYNRRYSHQTAFLVTEDGSIKIGSETLTHDQWVQVFDLRDANNAAMKALKESFKTISPVVS